MVAVKYAVSITYNIFNKLGFFCINASVICKTSHNECQIWDSHLSKGHIYFNLFYLFEKRLTWVILCCCFLYFVEYSNCLIHLTLTNQRKREINSHFAKLHANSQQANRWWIHYHWPQQHNLDRSAWVWFECGDGFVRVIPLKLILLIIS